MLPKGSVASYVHVYLGLSLTDNVSCYDGVMVLSPPTMFNRLIKGNPVQNVLQVFHRREYGMCAYKNFSETKLVTVTRDNTLVSISNTQYSKILELGL